MIGIINALPMSIVHEVTTLIPIPGVVREVLDREATSEDEVAWLWGHANSDRAAEEYARNNLGLMAGIRRDFGPRPTIVAHAFGGYVAITEDGEQVIIDKLVVLAPTFAMNKRKAEGEVAATTEILGFRPILVKC